MDQKKSVLAASLNGGITTGLILIIYALILYLLNVTTSKPLGYLSLLISGVLIFIFSKIYRDKELKGYISYGEALGFGVLVGLISSVLLGIFVFIEYKFLDPGLIDKLMDIAREKMLGKGIDQEQLEKALSISKWFMTPVVLAISTILFNTFVSFILSLITSAIVKKEKNPFDTAMKDIQ